MNHVVSTSPARMPTPRPDDALDPFLKTRVGVLRHHEKRRPHGQVGVFQVPSLGQDEAQDRSERRQQSMRLSLPADREPASSRPLALFSDEIGSALPILDGPPSWGKRATRLSSPQAMCRTRAAGVAWTDDGWASPLGFLAAIRARAPLRPHRLPHLRGAKVGPACRAVSFPSDPR